MINIHVQELLRFFPGTELKCVPSQLSTQEGNLRLILRYAGSAVKPGWTRADPINSVTRCNLEQMGVSQCYRLGGGGGGLV